MRRASHRRIPQLEPLTRFFDAAAAKLLLLAVATLATAPGLVAGVVLEPTPTELKKLSLEELMDIEVVLPSRRAEPVARAPAAIYVLTEEEIRRSGITSIPEALRLVPGVQVARIDSHTWAISARGFSSATANKLQVMMDGRIVYTPLFSGVFWDVQDTLLEDIAQIEVIRGPGASLWGANAVNGIINIVTKDARDTQGALVMGGYGTEERGFGGVRYGGKLGPNAHYRVYGKYFRRDDSALRNGRSAHDDWEMARGGFRVDWDVNERNELTFQGDLYGGEKSEVRTVLFPTAPFVQPIRDDTALSGGNVLARWTHHLSADSELEVQTYYDRTHRDIPRIFEEDRDTFDLDFHHRFAAGERHNWMWGVGYNVTRDEVENTYTVSWDPDHRSTQLFSAFLQDEVELIDERLQLTLGSKFEHNDFTGFEVQPNVRLAWTPAERQTFWTAVARAVRTPTRLDSDLRIRSPLGETFPPGSTALISGSRDFRTEKLIAYEAGYRVQAHARVTLILAAFYNDYEDLRSIETGAPRPVGAMIELPSILANELEGETYGGEAAVRVQVLDRWRLTLGYSHLRKHLRLESGSRDVTGGRGEGNDPEHQFFLVSRLDLPGGVEFDSAVRYVDRLPDPYVPSYVMLDVRLAWRPTESLELSLVSQNLLDDRHREFGTEAAGKEVEHSVYGKVTWRF